MKFHIKDVSQKVSVFGDQCQKNVLDLCSVMVNLDCSKSSYMQQRYVERLRCFDENLVLDKKSILVEAASSYFSPVSTDLWWPFSSHVYWSLTFSSHVDIPCNLNPCRNNGICATNGFEFGRPVYVCNCPLGYTGPYCEVQQSKKTLMVECY